jgi:hypothetical protein
MAAVGRDRVAANPSAVVIPRVIRRLIPFIFCYVVAYVDRVNIGFAQPTAARPRAERRRTSRWGLFFLGYCLRGPEHLVLERVGARL